MGLLLGIVRKSFLRMQKSNAEFRLLSITNAIATAQNSQSMLGQASTDYEATSLVAKKLMHRQAKLKALETRLEAQKSALERQIQEFTKEMESCDQLIQEGINKFFTINFGGR